MDTDIISPAQADVLLARQEGHFFDFKSQLAKPAKLSTIVAALANADGGEVYVGIEDHKVDGDRWQPFPDYEAVNQTLDALTRTFPPGEVFAYSFVARDGTPGVVLKIEVFKNASLWSDSGGDIRVRRGAQSLKLTGRDEIRRLEFAKGAHSFEDSKTAVDDQPLLESETLSRFLNNMVPTAAPAVWIRKQRLVVDDFMIVAGAVLFTDEPQIFLPKAAIKIYRYRTSEAPTRESLEGQPLTIEGCAYDQIKSAVSKVVETVEQIPVLRAEGAGFEAIRYPNNALHEIITNAVIHRDYSINDDIHIRIFDNRVEIFSPGRLPGHITPKNILDERYARNQKIVRLLNKFPDPPNKDVGEGLNTAFEAMRDLQLKDPEIDEVEAGVLIVLRHEKLAKPEQMIADFLRDNDEINNTMARKITFIGSENAVKRIFQKMMQAGIIERIPGRPQAKTAYRKGSQFPKA